MKAYLDNNVVCSIVRDDNKSESAALTRLLEARKKAKVEIVTSEITLEEIKRCPEMYRAPLERAFLLLSEIPIVRWGELMGITSDGWINSPIIRNDPLYDSLLALGLEQTDAKHIFVAAKHGCGFFITCDDKPPTSILQRSAKIQALCNLSVERPSQFVASNGW